MPRAPGTVIVLLVLSLLGACTSSSDRDRGGGVYVALGDSYVSGPGIGPEDPASPACRRSMENNYPQLIAAALQPEDVIDVSCGGATTETVREGRPADGQTADPPQLAAVTPDTTLVTVGIGANDESASAGLFTYCLISASATDRLCKKFTADFMGRAYFAARDSVETLLAMVKKRAPNARIVLVGYLRIVPDQGDCSVLPLSAANRASAARVESAWNTLQRIAAKRAGVTYVDMRRASKGHDACAGNDAWVNGVRNVPGDGVFLHANATGMRHVADEVLKVLRTR